MDAARGVSQARAKMTAGENRREVSCLGAAWVGCRDWCYVGGRRQGGGVTQTCPSIVRQRREIELIVSFRLDGPVLEGTLVRLEPLAHRHATDLAVAAEEDRSSYGFT